MKTMTLDRERHLTWPVRYYLHHLAYHGQVHYPLYGLDISIFAVYVHPSLWSELYKKLLGREYFI